MSMQVIEHQVMPSSTSTVTFTSIPQTYTDLLITLSIRSSADVADVVMTFNGGGGSYSGRRLLGTGSTVISDSSSNVIRINKNSDTGDVYASDQVYIPNYRSSSAKSYSTDNVTENNATAAIQMLCAGLWSGTDAISSISFQVLTTGQFVVDSSFTLYGITAGSDGTTTVS